MLKLIEKIQMVFSFILILCQNAFTYPEHFEIWLLGNPSQGLLNQSIKQIEQSTINSTAILISANGCQKVGEFCFDPQLGLYKEETSVIQKSHFNDEKDFAEVKDWQNLNDRDNWERPIMDAASRSIVNCEQSFFFDIFCGKASIIVKPNLPKKYLLEVWVDISSSLRPVDTTIGKVGCARQRFAEAVNGFCPFKEKLNIKVFDTVLRQADTYLGLCRTQGLNDVNRLKNEIRNSDAKNLIIITDISEYSAELDDFIKMSNGRGVLVGIEGKFMAKDLVGKTQEIKKFCQ